MKIFNLKSVQIYILTGFTLFFHTGSSAYGKNLDTPFFKSQENPVVPEYIVGTTFVYSNRTWEKIKGITNDHVDWIDYRGYQTQRPKDFIYRPNAWETSKAYGERTYDISTGFLFKKPTSIWPLKTGNEISYFENNSIPQKIGLPKTYRYYWRCKVLEKHNISVMAGKFETYKIIAKKYYTPRGPGPIRWRETITWYYAPEINHYVKIVRERHRKKTIKKELMAVLPPFDHYPKADKTALERVFQTALEKNEQGQSVDFQSTEMKIKMNVTPGRIFKTKKGTFGRRYTKKVFTPEYQQSFHGMAFRNASGVWVIPKR